MRCVAWVQDDAPLSNDNPHHCGLSLVRAAEGPCVAEVHEGDHHWFCGEPEVHSTHGFGPSYKHMHAYLGPWTHDECKHCGMQAHEHYLHAGANAEFEPIEPGHTPVPESEETANVE